ncbi:MAG: sirohydrochlorin chelatase [Rhodospirillales bacterium]|jgi:sirohydrochlorin cobaltochelatase
MVKTGIIICGHGSRSKSAEREFGSLATAVRKRFPSIPVEYGFLEYSSPNIHMGLDALLDAGVEQIVAVPGMLFAATHARNDIPSVLVSYQKKHPGLEIKYGRELALDPKMIAAFETRIMESLGVNHVHDGDLYDTMLVVVGRGTSDTNANAEAAKLTRIVTENLGFGWSETVYSGVTFPSVGQGLKMAVKLNYKKIVVAPYFLFSGRLVDRIQNCVDQVASSAPDVQFFMANYLSDQKSVIDTFVDRIEEAERGLIIDDHNLMASFKGRLSRGEVDVHHHHAEYRPIMDPEDDDAPGAHVHTHNRGDTDAHSHSHSHTKYKHIAHPNGPRTMIDQGVCCCFMSQFPQEVIDDERVLQSRLLIQSNKI